MKRTALAGLLILALLVGAVIGYSVGVSGPQATTTPSTSTTLPFTSSTTTESVTTSSKAVGCENQSEGSLTLGPAAKRTAPIVANVTGGPAEVLTGVPEYVDVPFNLTYHAPSSSQGAGAVTLLDYNAPANTWIGFLPGETFYNIGPTGTNGTIRIGGADVVSPTTPGATLVQINATLVYFGGIYNGGVTYGAVIAQCTIAILREFNGISTINSLQRPSIWFPVMTDVSTNPPFNVFGAVYDTSQLSPQQQSLNPTLSVLFSALGLVQNGSVEPLPDWLTVTITTPSLLLNASQPAWEGIGIVTENAPLGTYTVAIIETFNGQYGTIEDLAVNVVMSSVIF